MTCERQGVVTQGSRECGENTCIKRQQEEQRGFGKSVREWYRKLWTRWEKIRGGDSTWVLEGTGAFDSQKSRSETYEKEGGRGGRGGEDQTGSVSFHYSWRRTENMWLYSTNTVFGKRLPAGFWGNWHFTNTDCHSDGRKQWVSLRHPSFS